MAEKKETIVIPRVQRFLKKSKASIKKFNPYSILFILIFFLFGGLLILVTYLPISQSLKILGLLIGSFILEDLHHSLKSICLKNQNQN